MRQLRRRRVALHAHGHHDHTHHDHTHALPNVVAPLSRRGLVLLGTSGGLLPSPSAFLVLATGLFTGRTALALALVAAFSLGLGATLTAIGLLVLRGREALLERSQRWAWVGRLQRTAPLAAAARRSSASGSPPWAWPRSCRSPPMGWAQNPRQRPRPHVRSWPPWCVRSWSSCWAAQRPCRRPSPNSSPASRP